MVPRAEIYFAMKTKVLVATYSTHHVDMSIAIMVEQCGCSVSVLANVLSSAISLECHYARPAGRHFRVNHQIKGQPEVGSPVLNCGQYVVTNDVS